MKKISKIAKLIFGKDRNERNADLIKRCNQEFSRQDIARAKLLLDKHKDEEFAHIVEWTLIGSSPAFLRFLLRIDKELRRG